MKKVYGVGVALLILVGFLIVYFYVRVPRAEAPSPATSDVSATTSAPVLRSYKNAMYRIEGVDTTLVDGVSEVSAVPGSAEVITTTYFGNEAKTDLNGDGKEDVVFLLTHATGGTGLFYYVVAALSTEDGYKGSEAYFLGDRIAPQTTQAKGTEVIVNYVDRKEGATFAEPPTEGKTLRLHFDVASMKFITDTKKPTISWSYAPLPPSELVEGMDASPKTRVTLTFNGKSYDVGTYTGTCSPLDATTGESSLLPHEVSGVLCWWAGGGDEIGVFYENNSYVVKVGKQDEGDAKSPGFRGDFKMLLTF